VGTLNKLTRGKKIRINIKGKARSLPTTPHKVKMLRDATAIGKKTTKKVGKHISSNKGKYIAGAVVGTGAVVGAKMHKTNKENRSVKNKIKKALGR
jgi:hypothetical protein